MYDKGLKNLNVDFVVTLPDFKNEKTFIEKNPKYKIVVKAWKAQRSQIERVFGLVFKKFDILTSRFKGRGMRTERLGQIVLLAFILTNVWFAYENKKLGRKNLVNKNPSNSYKEYLHRIRFLFFFLT